MEKKRTGLYEGMYILNASLSDESRKKALEKITIGISHRGGEVCKMHDQGRRKLAYDIKGKREGHYYVLYFTAPTAAIKELWQEYHLHEDLLRFLTMRVEKALDTIAFQPLKQQ